MRRARICSSSSHRARRRCGGGWFGWAANLLWDQRQARRRARSRARSETATSGPPRCGVRRRRRCLRRGCRPRRRRRSRPRGCRRSGRWRRAARFRPGGRGGSRDRAGPRRGRGRRRAGWWCRAPCRRGRSVQPAAAGHRRLRWRRGQSTGRFPVSSAAGAILAARSSSAKRWSITMKAGWVAALDRREVEVEAELAGGRGFRGGLAFAQEDQRAGALLQDDGVGRPALELDGFADQQRLPVERRRSAGASRRRCHPSGRPRRGSHR